MQWILDIGLDDSKQTLPSDFNLNIIDIWDHTYSTEKLTFVDIIKGIVPLSLSTHLNSILKEDKVTLILEKFIHQIQEIFKEFI